MACRARSVAMFGLGLAIAVLSACSGGGSRASRDVVETTTATTVPIATTICVRQTEMVVFVNPAASPSVVDAIEAGLKQVPGVVEVVYVDHQAAYEEFRELYADSPELLQTVTPEALPTSFRLTLDDPARAEDVRSATETLDAVGEVVIPDAPPDPSVRC